MKSRYDSGLAHAANGKFIGKVDWPSAAELRRRVEQGATMKSLARELGCSYQRVEQVFRRIGLNVRAVRREQLRKLRARNPGATNIELSKMLGIHPRTVWEWQREMGLPSRAPSKKHGRYGYRNGCRCSVCVMTNRHDRHRSIRAHRKTTRPYRADRHPCDLCVAEGWDRPIKIVSKHCAYCGAQHEATIHE